jgi:hypothetical protein
MINPAPIQYARNEKDICDCCQVLFEAVTSELGAYMAAIESSYGHEMAQVAGGWWLDIFDRYDDYERPREAELRSITILAASQFAGYICGTTRSDAHDATGETEVECQAMAEEVCV